jgi:D-alanine-D-alanine ligase
LDSINLQQFTFYVVAPSVQTNDANLEYYYDFTQSINEYSKVFKELNCIWHWQPVTIANYAYIIENIVAKQNEKPFIINLCDGDDANAVPGVNVIYTLEKHNLPYTGASAFFYTITTSKIPMKQAFDACGVPNAKWKIINSEAQNSIVDLQKPVIIKPAVSGGSMGVSVKNVVHNDAELIERIAEIKKGYRGWNLMVDGLFVEEFITGKEYTTFIIGHYKNPESCIVYEPIYRKFHESLPKQEQFLSFDRLWEIYEEEHAMPNEENFYEYQPTPLEDVTPLKKITIDAFIACKGVGYARLDFRKDEITGKLYCLEINAQCGLSEDENYTSIGAIIKQSEVSFSSIIEKIIIEALKRN